MCPISAGLANCMQTDARPTGERRILLQNDRISDIGQQIEELHGNQEAGPTQVSAGEQLTRSPADQGEHPARLAIAVNYVLHAAGVPCRETEVRGLNKWILPAK